MAGNVKGVREGTHSITAHLIVNNGTQAVEFYQKAFGAELVGGGIHKTPDGRVMHAELKVGDSRFMLANEFPEMGGASAKTLGGSPVVLNLYSEDVDAMFDQAVKAGAQVTMPLENQFWGDRYGQIKDPFGHSWALGQHIEDVTPEEMERRSREIFGKMSKAEAK